MYSRQTARKSLKQKPDFRSTPLAVAIALALMSSAQAAPVDGTVRAGSAQISAQGNNTYIQQSSLRAIIDWRGFSISKDELVQFNQPSSSSATLNRVTGDQVSLILGRLDANGQIMLINPNGIIFGAGAQINVGSLIASTANIGNDNFMQGKLIFDQAGKPGSGIINSGSITAAEGGLVALVAPHIRNDGLIQARLGKVMLGAADTFTIDLYGDGLINLVLSDASLNQLHDSTGQPVKSLITQAGKIDVGNGEAVLVTAQAAKGLLDSLINMSGTILADSAVQQGGRILLLAKGGNAEVSGILSAQGTSGGQIEVLGDQVHLASTASLDASGAYGGGTLLVGGAYQGSGTTYRAQTTQVDGGALLNVSATNLGNAGEAIIWSDASTRYAGSILARGGAKGGNGGTVEVSGKQTLAFSGYVDAGASYGNAGTLLLDPINFTIGLSDAVLIDTVLRTGTSTAVSASGDINVNYVIDGRGGLAGGGLTLTAGNNVNVNDYIITNNGAINLLATAGTVHVASGKLVYAGAAPITVRTGATLTNAPYLTSGLLSLISTLGSVNIDMGIDGSIGNLFIQAADDVDINQPIVSLKDGNSVTIKAGSDINVDAQINGSGGTAGGKVTLAASQNVNINEHVVTNNGAISIAAGGTVIQKPDGLDIYGAPLTKQIRSGNAPISVTTGGDYSLGSLVTTGSLKVTSTAGMVSIDVPIYETTGNTTVTAAGDIDINEVAANNTAGSDLVMISTGGDINVNAKVGPWDRATGNVLDHNAVAGGSITLTAHSDINLHTDIASYKNTLTGAEDAAIRLTAQIGTINLDDGIKVLSDSGNIHATAFGNLQNGPNINGDLTTKDINGIYLVNLAPTTGYFTNCTLNLTSLNGDLTINQIISKTAGAVTLSAGDNIFVNQRIYTIPADITNDPNKNTYGADVSLIAGTKYANSTPAAGHGGITMTTIEDPDTSNASTIFLSDIDTGAGNLSFVAAGDINVATIRTHANLTMKSTNGFVDGGDTGNTILLSRGSGFPSKIELAGSLGIRDFTTGESNNIFAISDQGDVSHLGVDAPSSLTVIAAHDILMSFDLGNSPKLYAGHDIIHENGVISQFGQGLFERAGHDIQFGSYHDNGANIDVSYFGTSLDIAAGSNPFSTLPVGFQIAGVDVPSWSDMGPGNISASNLIWVEDFIQVNRTPNTGGFKAEATGNIQLADVHVSDDLNDPNQTTMPIQTQRPLYLHAGGSLSVNQIENMGNVTLIADNGDINTTKTIGAHVAVLAPASGIWNPDDVAPLSITITANNGDIYMAEARAVGDVTISAYGDGDSQIAGANGFISFGHGIESLSGTTSVTEYAVKNPNPYSFQYQAGTDYDTTISTTPIARLARPTLTAPLASPGPSIAGPGAPVVPGALPPGAPGTPGVAGIGVPGSGSNGSLTDSSNSENATQTASGEAPLSEIIPSDDGSTAAAGSGEILLVFEGGRGIAQSLDVGQGGGQDADALSDSCGPGKGDKSKAGCK